MDAEERPKLTVAVTGPTGEIGMPFVRALEATPEVGRVLAMARRPFDPGELGWRKTEYRQGDILDRDAVAELVADADVVVHLAFIVVKATAGSYDINIEGSRNVFEAAVAARAPRLVYTSSVAAYGYDRDRPGPLTEDSSTEGTESHAYSHQKAEVERVLDEAIADSEIDAYVFRPCVVAGPEAPALLDQLPYIRLEEKVPGAVRGAIGRVPGLKPVLPDHGIPFQLVHHDDVAAALVAATLGRGAPGVYNLAADGEITISQLASELGWRAVPLPDVALGVTSAILSRVPAFEAEAGWVEALRTPMAMDSGRAKRELGWTPRYDAHETLRDLISSRR